jgi:hypothetical protein
MTEWVCWGRVISFDEKTNPSCRRQSAYQENALQNFQRS